MDEPDPYETDEDMDPVVLAAGVLANDTDVDGGPLTAAVLGGPTRGAVTLNAGCSFTYRRDADFNGTDAFTYTASDRRGGRAAGTVTITVRPVNDPPTLAPAAFTLPENSPAGTAAGTVAGADVGGTDLRYRIVGGNTAGAFAIGPAAGPLSVANAAALDFETTATLTLLVEVRDPAGRVATAAVTVQLTDVITPPKTGIDLKDRANRINHRSNGKLSVAILSSAEFDARLLDVSSLRLGWTGQEDSVSRHPNRGPRYRLEDVDGDGRLDMVVEFEIEKTGFRPGDAKGILTGQLLNAFTFSVEDVVSVFQAPGRCFSLWACHPELQAIRGRGPGRGPGPRRPRRPA